MNSAVKPILVTGSHRSGSTWAGKILALAPDTGYIHEPFNVDLRHGVVPDPFGHCFQYVCDKNSDNYEEVLRKVINYEYPLSSNLLGLRTTRGAAKITRDYGLSMLHKIRGDTPIIKDPFAFFSAEWLCKTFDMNALIMIRHPAAFCSSLKLMNWKFDFNHFLEQPLLMDRYLGEFEEEIREFAENENDIIQQAILLWNCIHHTINIYQKNHPEWLFVKHEDLSMDPVTHFQSIYQSFDLELTDRIKSKILKLTGDHNPSEQQRAHEIVRDSKVNIYNWKNRLSQNEINVIMKKTYESSTSFYAENEW
jgi:Sulfotransferase family